MSGEHEATYSEEVYEPNKPIQSKTFLPAPGRTQVRGNVTLVLAV